ncbi:MAG: hypothetical protein FJ045_05295 [Crenarchaeota archaeon]|nr:hypothetical protein [Thermoproteota archaeon]
MRRLHIANGNRKLAKDIAVFSLPRGITCPGKTEWCVRHCYAQKAERYAGPALARANNYAVSQSSEFGALVDAWLLLERPKLFRIHEGGDFYSQEYLDKWIGIATRSPSTKFLAMSKSFGLDYSLVPSNMNILWSVVPDTNCWTVPAGPRAYAGNCAGKEKTMECRGKCGPCKACWHLRDGMAVHFKQH